MRIGELLDLELDCVHEVPGAGAWLKVPVGKLDTERMVPIDEEALALRLVITVVGHHLDTSAFHAGRKTGGAGAAGYGPDMLVLDGMKIAASVPKAANRAEGTLAAEAVARHGQVGRAGMRCSGRGCGGMRCLAAMVTGVVAGRRGGVMSRPWRAGGSSGGAGAGGGQGRAVPGAAGGRGAHWPGAGPVGGGAGGGERGPAAGRPAGE